MAMHTPRFAEYRDRYPHWRMERSADGILQLTFHHDGGEAEWNFEVHHETAFLWQEIGADPETKVIIVTGTGDAFLRRTKVHASAADRDVATSESRAIEWIHAHPHAKRLVMALLEIEQPMVAALNGPCSVHAELPLLCDVVLAAEHTVIADAVHFPAGLVPGDGVQILYPLLMGLNRARYFMLLGQELSASQCLELGLVNEVLPANEVLTRAWQVARQILAAPPMTVRLFRPTMLQHLKRLFVDDLSHGLMMEGMAAVAQWPQEPPKQPTGSPSQRPTD